MSPSADPVEPELDDTDSAAILRRRTVSIAGSESAVRQALAGAMDQEPPAT